MEGTYAELYQMFDDANISKEVQNEIIESFNNGKLRKFLSSLNKM